MQIAGMPGMFALTLSDYINIVADDFAVTIHGTLPHRHLQRYHLGLKKIGYIPYGLQDRDLLTEQVLRSLCSQLAIPILHFAGYVVP
jgi:hypothetical protein